MDHLYKSVVDNANYSMPNIKETLQCPICLVKCYYEYHKELLATLQVSFVGVRSWRVTMLISSKSHIWKI